MCRSKATRRTSPRLIGVLVVAAYLALGAVAPAAPAAWAAAAAAASAASTTSTTPTASTAAVRTAMSVSAPQGSTVTLTGNVSVSSSCPAGAPIQLTSTPAAGGQNLFPNGMGPQVPRDAGGNFQATFLVPATTPVGSYTIGLQCGGAVAGASETLNVTAAPHAPPSIMVTPATAKSGDSVTISGVVPTAGTVFCPAGDATQLTSTAALFPPDGFGPQLPRDNNGNFHTTYVIPTTATPGKYAIGMRCGGGNVGIAATLQVTATAPTTTAAPSTTSSTSTSTPAPTTTVAPPATVAPTTTVPVTTTARPPASNVKSKASSKSLRWVALAVLALVVLAAASVLARRRG